MTNPSCLTDAELLRIYEDLFRQHPATAELAERFDRAINPRLPMELYRELIGQGDG